MAEQYLTRRDEINGTVALVGKRPAWCETFIAALSTGAQVKAAAEAAGIHRRTAYNARDRDPAFARAWDQAAQDGAATITDALEAEAVKRALEYSDPLLLALLRSRRPEIYGDRVTVEHGAPADLADAREALLRKFERFALPAAASVVEKEEEKPC